MLIELNIKENYKPTIESGNRKMFQNWILVGATVADLLSGTTLKLNKGVGHIVWGHELVYISNSEKYQILGEESVKWSEEHFIDIDKTAERLAMEVSEQVGEYRREGRVIISAEAWLAKVDAFELKRREWNNRLWLEDPEKLEIERWANFLETQENPIFQDLASFLNCHLNVNKAVESAQSNPHCRELLESEIDVANKLADFLANHSNELLREGADWIPQWMEAH